MNSPTSTANTADTAMHSQMFQPNSLASRPMMIAVGPGHDAGREVELAADHQQADRDRHDPELPRLGEPADEAGLRQPERARGRVEREDEEDGDRGQRRPDLRSPEDAGDRPEPRRRGRHGRAAGRPASSRVGTSMARVAHLSSCSPGPGRAIPGPGQRHIAGALVMERGGSGLAGGGPGLHAGDVGLVHEERAGRRRWCRRRRSPRSGPCRAGGRRSAGSPAGTAAGRRRSRASRP